MIARRRIGVSAFVLVGLLGASAGLARSAGLYLNLTRSAPIGMWRLVPIARGVRAGAMVAVCPPASPVVAAMRARGALEAGDCRAAGTVPLLKPVVATAGDRVETARAGIRVNGRLLPNSRPLPRIAALARGSVTVPTGWIWVVSSYTPASFDSRYFGPVPLAAVRGLAVPLAVIGDPARLTIGGQERDRDRPDRRVRA